MSGTSGSTTPTINIPNYPSSNLVPGFYFSVTSGGSNNGTVPKRALMLGQMLGTSTLTPNMPVISSGAASDAAAAGQGSILAGMTGAYRALDGFTEMWTLPLADDPAANAAAGAIALTGPATGSGTLSTYIAGILVPLLVTAGMTASQVATALAALINLTPSLPVTAVATGANVAVTAKNKGLCGNDIDIRFNFQGAASGEVFPAGIAATVTPMSGGTQNPTALATALGNLADQPFDFIASAYTDTASLNALQSFLSEQTTTGRWSPVKQIFGNVFTAFRGTLSQRTTFLAGRNDKRARCLPFYDSPSPAWAWAASFAAAAALSAQENPALPIKGYPLPVLAPPVASQDTLDERQVLLSDGGSTFRVNAGGQVVIERAVSTYTTNPTTSTPDASFRNAEVDPTLTACVRDLQSYLAGLYPRNILVADGSLIPGGSAMVTSKTILTSAIARYRTQCLNGWCQNPDEFAKKAQAVNAGNGVVQMLLPYQLANQLIVVAGNVQFTQP